MTSLFMILIRNAKTSYLCCHLFLFDFKKQSLKKGLYCFPFILNSDTRMNDTMTSFEAWPGRMAIPCLLVDGIKQFMSIP